MGLYGSVLFGDSRIAVMDFSSRRLSVFDTLGTFVASYPHARESLNLSLPWHGRSDGDGHLYDLDAPTHEVLVKHAIGEGLVPIDSLRIQTLNRDEYTYTIERGPFTEIANVPFSPSVKWTVSHRGTVWLGNTSESILHEVSMAGDTIASSTMPHVGAPVDARERDSIAQAIGVPSSRIPAVKPSQFGLVAGTDGRLWVMLTDSPVHRWWVVEGDGRPVGTVTSDVGLLPSPRPAADSAGIVGVTVDALGVQSVVRLRLPARQVER